jgi:hypothetical protein
MQTQYLNQIVRLFFPISARRFDIDTQIELPIARTLNQDTYCSMFDLTTNMPLRPSDRNRLHLIDVETLSDSHPSTDVYDLLFDRLSDLISSRGYSSVPNYPVVQSQC